MASIDFTKSYDIVVCGGGVAGVSAALAGTRAGFSVALIEKTVFLGGLATTGNVLVYLPLCDGKGNIVTKGISEELFHESLKYGPGEIPQDWATPGTPSRYKCRFNPASFIMALDEICEIDNLSIWFDTLVCSPVIENSRITGIEIENKSGRGLIKGSCFIDATGDADIAFRAGAPCAEGSGNRVSLWALTYEQDRIPPVGLSVHHAPEGSNGISGKQITGFVKSTRKLLRTHTIEKQKDAGKSNFYPVTLQAMAGVRMTRRIDGMETVTEQDVNTYVETSIGITGDWRDPGDKDVRLWEIPWGSLVARKIKGLLAAGRCISTDGDAWDAIRVIPPAALTGEVCGLAAAAAIQKDTTPDMLDFSDVSGEVTKKVSRQTSGNTGSSTCL